MTDLHAFRATEESPETAIRQSPEPPTYVGQAVFVASSRRRDHAVRLAVAGLLGLAALWAVALVAGLRGFGTLPGLPLAPQGGPPVARAEQHPDAADRSAAAQATVATSAEPQRRDDRERAPASQRGTRSSPGDAGSAAAPTGGQAGATRDTSTATATEESVAPAEAAPGAEQRSPSADPPGGAGTADPAPATGGQPPDQARAHGRDGAPRAAG